MKTELFSCDYQNCSNKTTNLEINNWIEIGSTNGSLFILNHLNRQKLIKMSNNDDIHFCSIDCLVHNLIHVKPDKKQDISFDKKQLNILKQSMLESKSIDEVIALLDVLIDK